MKILQADEDIGKPVYPAIAGIWVRLLCHHPIPPLTERTLVFSAVASSEAGLFRDDIQVRLLEEMSLDISFALGTMKIRIEQKRAEAALLVSEERLASIIDLAMDAIVSIDENQRIVLANPAAERMFRYAKGELIGQPLDKLLPASIREIHGQHIKRFGETGVTTRSMGNLGELRGLRANGLEFFSEASISQIEFAEKKLFTVILRDITARKQAEEAIEAREKHYRSLIENSADSIVLFEENGNIRYASPAVARLWGIRLKNILMQNIWSLIHPDDVQALERPLS